jgi:ABC-type uncharacterized transport system permease subunit
MSTNHFIPNKHNLILTAIFTVVFFVLSILITPVISILVIGEPSLQASKELINNPLFGLMNLLLTTTILYLLASLSIWYHDDQINQNRT